jgi:hypothetical protein
MLSQTRRALEDFDNQHEFERLAADVLNALGYSHVEPMAPRGGPDGGRDVKFTESDVAGIAFATLDKDIEDKFKRDLKKHPEVTDGLIALFCTAEVSPAKKMGFTRLAFAKGYRLEIFDLERLRSLLDTSLKVIRRRYLHIDDKIAAQLRSDVHKLLRFPAPVPDRFEPQTQLEAILAEKLPGRLFDVLMQYEEADIQEVPGIGVKLSRHLHAYYEFRTRAKAVQALALIAIGKLVTVRFAQAWAIHLRYALWRFGGAPQEVVISHGEGFLNYDITWQEAEQTFVKLQGTPEVATEIGALFQLHATFSRSISALVE